MASYIVDGDKGGVGKSFLARAIADYLIISKTRGRIAVIDCDPSNADVVCPGGFDDAEKINELEVLGVKSPVASQEDWFATVDRATKYAQQGEIDFVFSLPAGAGLYIDDTVLSMFGLIGPVKTIWVMGKDQSSVAQLEERVNRAPMFYEKGVVALNEYHGAASRGTFSAWQKSMIHRQIVRADGWHEIYVPALNAFVTRSINTMPLHRAVALSEKNELSPTIKIGIEAFRRAFRVQLTSALEKLDD